MFFRGAQGVFSDSYPAEILTKAHQSPDQITSGDRFALDNMMSEVVFAAYYYHTDIARGRINGRAWPLTLDWAMTILSSHHGKVWWSKNKPNFAPDVVKEIDQALDGAGKYR